MEYAVHSRSDIIRRVHRTLRLDVLWSVKSRLSCKNVAAETFICQVCRL